MISPPKINSDLNKTNRKKIPEKSFKVRDSVLTTLYENQHVKSAYNILAIIIISLLINNIIIRSIYKDGFDNSFIIIRHAFKQFSTVVAFWCTHLFFTSYCFFVFIFWAKFRCNIPIEFQPLCDIALYISLLLYICLTTLSGLMTVLLFDLPLGSASVLIFEEIRFSMKIYAFVRSCTPYGLDYQFLKKLPKFKHFLYFLFAPTLIYKDEYPRSRTDGIRWNFIFHKVAEVILAFLFFNFLLQNFFVPSYQYFGVKKITWLQFVLLVIANSVVGILVLFSAFYMFFHSWLNLFAELLQFGDRFFYDDWWNSTSPIEFINKWNIIMNNWLYMYVYKDVYEYIPSINKKTAKFCVFLFSAITHEIHAWFMLKFCLPALFIQYIMFGLIISCFVQCNNKPIPKLMFWLGVAFGSGHIISLYTMEVMLRINNPQPRSVYDLFVPRLLNTSTYIE